MKSHDAFLDWINAEFGMTLGELVVYTQEFYPEKVSDKIEMDIVYGLRSVFWDLDRVARGREKISKYWDLFNSYKCWICDNGQPPYPTQDQIDSLIFGAESGNKDVYTHLEANMSEWFLDGYATSEQWHRFYKLKSVYTQEMYDLIDKMCYNK